MAEEEKIQEEVKEESVEEAAPEAPTEEKSKKKKDRKAEKQNEEMEKLRAELEEEKSSRLRLAAEYDNYRKRTAKEKDHIYTDAVADTHANVIVDTDKKEEKKPFVLSVEEEKPSADNQATNSSTQDKKGLDKTDNAENNRRKETEEKIPAKAVPVPTVKTNEDDNSSAETKPISKKQEEKEVIKETNENSPITPVENEEEKKIVEQDLIEVIKKGEQHEDIPDTEDCEVFVNEEETDYQNYRNGIKTGGYRNPDVKSIQRNKKGKVIKIVVSVDK